MRWVARRKAAIVEQIEAGELTVEEACARYELSREELASWQTSYQQHGVLGLRTTRQQFYRGRRQR